MNASLSNIGPIMNISRLSAVLLLVTSFAQTIAFEHKRFYENMEQGHISIILIDVDPAWQGKIANNSLIIEVPNASIIFSAQSNILEYEIHTTIKSTEQHENETTTEVTSTISNGTVKFNRNPAINKDNLLIVDYDEEGRELTLVIKTTE